MAEKIITKSFERLLDKGRHRGFITYEELGKSLGKRNGTEENIEKALIILVDEKCPLIGIKLNELTKKFPKLNANILGVIRDDKFVIMKKFFSFLRLIVCIKEKSILSYILKQHDTIIRHTFRIY